MKSMKKWRNALMVHFHHNCNITLLPIFYKRNVIFLAVIFQHCNKKNVIAAVEQCTSCKKKSTVALIFFSRNVFRMYLFVSWTILRIELQASSIFPTWLRPARERYIPQREGPILQGFLREKKRTYFSHELVQKY